MRFMTRNSLWATAVVLLVALLPLLAASPAAAQDPDQAFADYVNARFGYACAYPADFEPQPEADNGDGRRFLSVKRNAEAACWGSVLFMGDMAEEAADIIGIMEEAGTSVTYSRVEPDWFVLSGFEEDGRIFYRRTILRDGVLVSFLLRYPQSSRDAFDPVVAAMAQGLRFMH